MGDALNAGPLDWAHGPFDGEIHMHTTWKMEDTFPYLKSSRFNNTEVCTCHAEVLLLEQT